MRFILLLLCAPAFARVNFERQVAPILETNCVRCHGEDRAFKNLRLDRQDRALQAIVPKKPDESTLYLAAKAAIMPPGPAKLSAEELETLRRWIAEGARWPKRIQLHAK